MFGFHMIRPPLRLVIAATAHVAPDGNPEVLSTHMGGGGRLAGHLGSALPVQASVVTIAGARRKKLCWNPRHSKTVRTGRVDDFAFLQGAVIIDINRSSRTGRWGGGSGAGFLLDVTSTLSGATGRAAGQGATEHLAHEVGEATLWPPGGGSGDFMIPAKPNTMGLDGQMFGHLHVSNSVEDELLHLFICETRVARVS